MLVSFDPAKQPLPTPDSGSGDAAGAAVERADPASPHAPGLLSPFRSPLRSAGACSSPSRRAVSPSVFVSPMRPPRAAALFNSPSHARNIYAFVGQSTQAFQSPAMDLDSINGRLIPPIPLMGLGALVAAASLSTESGPSAPLRRRVAGGPEPSEPAVTTKRARPSGE